MQTTQKRNVQLARLHRVVRDNVPTSSWGINLKLFKRYAKGILIQEGILYYRTKSGVITPILTFDLLVDVTVTYHVRMGHVGRDKLQAGVEAHMWHPKIGNIVRELCGSCAVCQTMKIGHQLTVPPTVRVQASDPFDLVSADLMEMPPSSSGKCALLVMIDHFTKWACAVPIQDKTSRTVSQAMKNQVLPTLLRVPRRMLTDNGSEFIGPQFQELLRTMNIQHLKTTPLTPAANGEVERMNRTIQELLRGYGAKIDS